MIDDDFKNACMIRTRAIAADRDRRDMARECLHFTSDKWGQWEEKIYRQFEGRPRFQFDLVKPVIQGLAKEIMNKEYGGHVILADGDADKKTGDIIEQMLRTISNMSNAPKYYKRAGLKILRCGFDAWRVTTDWADVDAFEQDILISYIDDAVNRVWFPDIYAGDELKNRRSAFVDTFLSDSDYKKKFPNGSGMSVDSDSMSGYYNADIDGVTVSDYYYLKDQRKELVLLSDGSVFDAEKYEPLAASYSARGAVEVRRRSRDVPRAFMRKMDAGGWLSDEMELPFSYIPVVGCWANFEILENKAQYKGEVESLMDPQRTYNYATSREMADGALAPVDKMAMTPSQAQGHEAQNRRLNTANDPIFLYNPDKMAPPPFRTGGPQPNPQLLTTANRAQQDIKEISQSHNPMQGAGISGHSGVAYEILNNKSESGVEPYLEALKQAVQDTNTIIIDALPRVYDTKNRQVRLTQQDDSTSFVPINEEVFDPATQKMEMLNDLSKGHYKFKAIAGPAYNNKKSEAVDVMTKWAQVDPAMLEFGRDIIYSSLDAPGTDQIGDRVRAQMVQSGQIPSDQLTDEEREKIEAEAQAAANQPPNPMDEATIQAIVAEVANIQSQTEERQLDMQVKMQEQQRKMLETMMKIEAQQASTQKTQSETLENLKEATGADAIINENVAVAYNDVAEDIANPTGS